MTSSEMTIYHMQEKKVSGGFIPNRGATALWESSKHMDLSSS